MANQLLGKLLLCPPGEHRDSLTECCLQGNGGLPARGYPVKDYGKINPDYLGNGRLGNYFPRYITKSRKMRRD